MSRNGLFILSTLVSMVAGTHAFAAPPASAVDFSRDVQPILLEYCAKCHGVDAKNRKAKLRLDTREGALAGGQSGEPAIVPGKPEKSEFYLRLTSHDADAVMPPPREKKTLSAVQIETIKRWITEGAKYESHWAFAPPRKSALPTDTKVTSPIDAFVRSRLKREKLTPSAPADKATLCRRLYLDLIGLPPSPADLDAFEKEGPSATIKKLLASERFGEKWGRHWLDLARYSDTNGYEKDMPREMWIWRDWVIESLNKDMPYDRFIVEQIAGDLLPNAGQSQRIATGFLRNSMINEEGAIVPEQFRMVEMFDRLDCVGKAILGVTTQCSQCHSHKFDPVSMKDYYGMFAFLNNAYEAQSWVYTAEQLQQIETIRKNIASAENRIRTQKPGWEKELAAWAQAVSSQKPVWTPIKAIEMGSISGLNHPTQEADLSLLMKGHTSDDVFLIAAPKLNGVTGLQIEALNHRDLPHNGPGRSRQGTWAMKAVDVFVKTPKAKDWEKVKLINATCDYPPVNPNAPKDKPTPGAVANLIDGKD
ncbi:MAG: DUF1549 domain-containing protein, partial [Gemmataceae bacterium]